MGPLGSQTYRLPFGPTFGEQDASGIHFGFGSQNKNSVWNGAKSVMQPRATGGVGVGRRCGVSLLTLLRQKGGAFGRRVCVRRPFKPHSKPKRVSQIANEVSQASASQR